MANDINTLLFTHGAIQTSPEQVIQLNKQAPAVFFDHTVASSPTKAGYQVMLSGYCAYIQKNEMGTNSYRNLLSLLNQLVSMPRSEKAYVLKGSVTTFSLSNDFYRVDYRIYSGQVEVFNIQPTDRLQLQRDRLEKTAVYKVKKNSSGVWAVGQRMGETVDTKYAAVNGQSNNLAKATWLMGKHLEHAYGKGFNEYTLFHNPSVGGMGDTWESVRDKFGFTTGVTKKFAGLLEKAQQKSSDTYWVAHSQGGLIFTEGVRYLLNGKSSWALNQLSLNGRRIPNKGEFLDKQKVTFHGNANNNMRSKFLFDRAGVEVVAVKGHDYDFVTNIIGLNTANPRKFAGSLVYASHVFNGSISQSPHTTVQSHESWEKNMLNGPGKGRSPIQKAFNALEKGAQKTVNIIKNYLP